MHALECSTSGIWENLRVASKVLSHHVCSKQLLFLHWKIAISTGFSCSLFSLHFPLNSLYISLPFYYNKLSFIRLRCLASSRAWDIQLRKTGKAASLSLCENIGTNKRMSKGIHAKNLHTYSKLSLMVPSCLKGNAF